MFSGLPVDEDHEMLAASIDGATALLSYESDPDQGYDHSFVLCPAASGSPSQTPRQDGAS